jgi:hypothetical protein
MRARRQGPLLSFIGANLVPEKRLDDLKSNIQVSVIVVVNDIGPGGKKSVIGQGRVNCLFAVYFLKTRNLDFNAARPRAVSVRRQTIIRAWGGLEISADSRHEKRGNTGYPDR